MSLLDHIEKECAQFPVNRTAALPSVIHNVKGSPCTFDSGDWFLNLAKYLRSAKMSTLRLSEKQEEIHNVHTASKGRMRTNLSCCFEKERLRRKGC